MVSVKTVRELALALPEVTEAPHFDKQSFRVKEKIFATLWDKEKFCVLMFSPLTQSLFLKADPAAVYPHPSKWGLKGATVFELPKVKKEWLRNALVEAYCEKAPRKLADAARKNLV
jgi:hypothetical protein